MSEQSFINQRELAQRWGISPRTLERWRWLGAGLRFLKLGGRVVYRMEDVEAFEAERLRSSTSQTQPLIPDYQNERAVAAPDLPRRALR
jgi:hypothetical protein